MAAHPGVCITSSLRHRSSELTTTPLAFRHRYHTRRRRCATGSTRMAAAHGGGGGGDRRNTGGSLGDGGGGGGGSGPSRTATSSLENQLGRPPDADGASSGMQVDGHAAGATERDGGGGGGERGEAESSSSLRWSRVFSCPAVERQQTASAPRGASAPTEPTTTAARLRPSSAFVVDGSADNVSSSKGITMGDIHGSVRAKTVPAEASTPAVREDDHVDTARADIVCLKLSGDPTPLGDGGGEGGGQEQEVRRLRAFSSGPTLFPASSPEASNKRVKSGTVANHVVSNGSQDALMTDSPAPPGAPQHAINPTPFSSALSSMPIGAEGGAATPAIGGAAATAAIAAAAPPVALTNEEWVAQLTPLLPSIPGDTHPEDYLHELLRERGYTTEMVAMKETVYHRKPEPDQVAAYDKAILRAVLDEDETALERMRAAGRRMDACNRFGDSVLHMACRRGRSAALRFLLRATGPAGAVLSDDFGRTVMHDACWTSSPRFDVASTVLDADTRLLRTLDSRGSSPLQYVPQDQWPLWCAFFESRKEVYWPQLAPGVEDVAGIMPVTEIA